MFLNHPLSIFSVNNFNKGGFLSSHLACLHWMAHEMLGHYVVSNLTKFQNCRSDNIHFLLSKNYRKNILKRTINYWFKHISFHLHEKGLGRAQVLMLKPSPMIFYYMGIASVASMLLTTWVIMSNTAIITTNVIILVIFTIIVTLRMWASVNVLYTLCMVTTLTIVPRTVRILQCYTGTVK